MTALCLSNGNSTVAFDCIGQPRQEAVESKDAKRLQQHTHTPHASDRPAKKAVESKRCNPGSGAATTSHGVCKP